MNLQRDIVNLCEVLISSSMSEILAYLPADKSFCLAVVRTEILENSRKTWKTRETDLRECTMRDRRGIEKKPEGIWEIIARELPSRLRVAKFRVKSSVKGLKGSIRRMTRAWIVVKQWRSERFAGKRRLGQFVGQFLRKIGSVTIGEPCMRPYCTFDPAIHPSRRIQLSERCLGNNWAWESWK